jgi:ferredoxin-NADP reductase
VRQSAAVAPLSRAGPAGRVGGAGPAIGAGCFGALGFGGGLAVLALWWHGLASAGPGGPAIAAGRAAGLLAAYGSLVQVLLRARVPVLERGLGARTIGIWHGLGGVAVLTLASTHACLIVAGYALASGTGSYRQLWTLLTGYPGVLMAAVALLLLLGVGVTTFRWVRRRLRYQSWHFLHLYGYLVVLLAFSHQVANGQDFRHREAARAAWIALYLLVAGLLLWYRMLRPIWVAARHRLTVSRVVAQAPGVVSVHITGRRLDRLPVVAGQYFRWRFLTRGLWWTANPYSLSEAPAGDRFRITIKAVGPQSRLVGQLRAGTRVVAEGPGGGLIARRPGTDGRTRRGALLIAGGIGITPLRALFESLPCRPGELTLLYRTHSAASTVFSEELDRLAADLGHRVVYLIGPREQLADLFDPASLRRLAPDLSTCDVYLCGPPGMAGAVRRGLVRAGVKRRRIRTESFHF